MVACSASGETSSTTDRRRPASGCPVSCNGFGPAAIAAIKAERPRSGAKPARIVRPNRMGNLLIPIYHAVAVPIDHVLVSLAACGKMVESENGDCPTFPHTEMPPATNITVP